MKLNIGRHCCFIALCLVLGSWLTLGQSGVWPGIPESAPQIETHRPEVKAQKVQLFMDHQGALLLEGTDSKGDALTFQILAPPQHGTLSPIESVNGSSARTVYTPNPGYRGVDEFTYAATDGLSIGPSQVVRVYVLGPGENPAKYDVTTTGEFIGDSFARFRRSADPRPEAYNAANWYISGSLGVGTDTPTYAFQLLKSNPWIHLLDSDSSGAVGIIFGNSTYDDQQAIIAYANGTGDFNIDKNINYAAKPFFVQHSSGYVGMGTTSPYQQVTVSGTIGWLSAAGPMMMMGNLGPANNSRMILAYNPGSPRIGIRFDDQVGDMIWQFNDASPILNVGLGSSRVGIHTNTPTSDLDVRSLTTNPRIRVSAPSTSANRYPSIQGFDSGPAVGTPAPVAQFIMDTLYGRAIFDYAYNLGGDFSVRRKLDDNAYTVFKLDSDGNAIFGGGAPVPGNVVTINGSLRVNGSISKTGGGELVRIEDGDREIEYSVAVGPELGTYVRGSAQLVDGQAIIELPEHFAATTSDTNLTVQVTLRDDCNGVRVAESSVQRIVVRELGRGTSSARFDYLVQGVRKGYENHRVVYPKGQSPIEP